MSVDIVIVTFRSEDAIVECLDSIPEAHRRTVVVIENDSGDAAPELARRAGVHVVENTDNRGFGASANQGAALGSSDLILFLNPDARLRPGVLESLTEAFDDPMVAVAGVHLIHPDGEPQKSLWPYPTAPGLWAESLGLKRMRPHTSGGFVVGACFAVRRAMFEALGGFDERYWLYGEEADLCFRAASCGWKVVLSDVEVDHEGGASGRELGDLVFEHFSRGSERFVLLHHGPVALVSYRLAGLVGALIRWPLLRMRDRDDPRADLRRRQVGRFTRLLLTSPTRVEDATATPGRRLTILSLEAWDEVWRRNQFLVRELLEMNPDLRVLWVEPPHDPAHEFVANRRLPTLSAAALRPLPGEPRVLRFQPRKWLPRIVWPFVDQGLCRQVRSAMRRGGFADSIVWINDSTYAPLAAGGSSRSIYDITDDWLDAQATPREGARRRSREEVLMGAVDEVIVCSPTLAERRGAIRPVHLIPNAVDVEHFRKPQARPADLPDGPVVVYVGTLHEDRLDLDLIERLATEMRELSVTMVGPVALSSDSRSRLERHPNIVLLGPRPYASVPAYLQHADTVIVPHAVNPFTDSLDPIKAYECLALDRPTVATPVNGFAGLGAPIHVVPAPDFVDEVRRCISARVRHHPADVPGWRVRAEQFWAVISATSA